MDKRLLQHQIGEGANHTKKYSPAKLVYLEQFQNISDAFNREKQIQGWSRVKKEALIKGVENDLVKLSKAIWQKD
jgi:putative endonuclease